MNICIRTLTGAVATTLVGNNAFEGRKPMLTAINAGHWLLVLLVMGWQAAEQYLVVQDGRALLALGGATLFVLSDSVLAFNRAIAPLVEPLDRLAHGKITLVPSELVPYFRDVFDHLIRDVEQVSSFRDLLTSILDANLTAVSVRQNEDMRKISAWVAIAAVPTMIAGIYGMNFEHMPELEWRFGYPLALGVMLAICLSLHRYFTRAGWL
jgi:magnesium transporter